MNVIKIAFMKQKKREDQTPTIKKRLRKKQKITKKSNDETLVIKEDENIIDISLIEKILPTIKSKLKVYNNNNNQKQLENILKNLKTPISITTEIVDLFLTKPEQPSVPMFMYT
jgi:hypothetical protein